MVPLKSPGPNEFIAGFYQHHWETVGPEVCHAALQFLYYFTKTRYIYFVEYNHFNGTNECMYKKHYV
jgi:hypothetical protein